MPSQTKKNNTRQSLATETRAIEWISACMPECTKPSGEILHLIYHLLGTDRAFGLFFPEFFLEGLPLPDTTLTEAARRMFLASRAYLIADDAIRDRDRTEAVRAVLATSVPRFRTACLEAAGDWGLDARTAARLLGRRERLAEWAYSRDITRQPPCVASTCLRCSLWYFTFDALKHNLRTTQLRFRRRSFTEALFLLQLADDYADIDSDLQRTTNWSLLCWGGTSREALFSRIPRAQLRGYALLAMYGLARQLAREANVAPCLRLWADAVKHLVAFPRSVDPEKLLRRCFPGRLPESFSPPSLCHELEHTDITDIHIRTMNGVSLSAESVNSFATLRALAEGLPA